MQFSTIAAAFLSTLTLVSAVGPDSRSDIVIKSSAEIQERQSLLVMEGIEIVEEYLTVARSESVGKVRGRRLTEASERKCEKTPTTNCDRCMDDLVILAVSEVMGCGVAALGVGVVSGGAGAVLAATGFLACDAAAYANYDKGILECRSY
ncbi:hypothetical protein JHW43_004768 [Diplocarpon mali]|nr:hypothetical protein JHW43_004768 [Diplocarpon mali]